MDIFEYIFKQIRKYLIILLIILSIFLIPNIIANANEISLLDELKLADNFNEENYKELTLNELEENESLDFINVIHVGESGTNQLYIYTYQPCYNYIDTTAYQISMSTEYSYNGDIRNPNIYDIELVDKEGVFSKYVVKNFKINRDEYRYYNIVAIYRKLNDLIDTNIVGGITNGIAINVGQQWCYYYSENSIQCEMNTFNTIELTPVLNGTILVDDGADWDNLLLKDKKYSVHFLAFKEAENEKHKY